MRQPMGDARLWEMHACERQAYEVAYRRCTPVRYKPMGWPMGDAPYEMAYERGTPMRDSPMG